MRKSLVIAGIFLLMAGPVWAANNFSNEVLAIGVGSRALGMGGAFVGLADDSTAVYWNPAGLPQVKNIEIAVIQQGQQVEDLGLNEVGSRYMFFSGALTLPKVGTFGAAFMRFGVDEIPYVAAAPLPGASPCPSGCPNFKTQDFAFMASYARELHPTINAGLSAKLLTGGTDGLADLGFATGDASYSYWGFDLGIKVDFGAMTPNLMGLNLGLNVQDAFGSKVVWSGTLTNPQEDVALNAKVGLAYDAPWQFLTSNGHQLRFAFDVDPKYTGNMLYHFGGEFWYKRTVAFRSGFRQFAAGLQDTEMSLGLSVRYAILQVDYAYVNYELTPIHFMSLAVKF